MEKMNRFALLNFKIAFSARYLFVPGSFSEILAPAALNNNNNNNNSRISIPPSVVTSEAVAEPVRSRKSAIVG